MTAPQLLFAEAVGQSAVRVLFDQPMRQLGPNAPEDPANVANWSVGGGLPAIASVNRISSSEFELVLDSPAPVAGGYTVTVAATVQNMETPAESMDAGAVTPPAFAVTEPDLVVVSAVWASPTVVVVTFSEPLLVPSFTQYSEVVAIRAQEVRSREPAIAGYAISGATATVTFSAACTAGASYLVEFVRDNVVSSTTGTVLKSGDENVPVWGQGAAPYIAADELREDLVQITSSEVLGTSTSQTWPLIHGLYGVDVGSLGPSVPLTLGSSPAILRADGAELPSGGTATFEISKSTRTVQTGVSVVDQADFTTGAGGETVGATTVLNKTPGAPFELVFSSGSGSLTRAGRSFELGLDISFTAGPTNFPLLAITLLNTQTSVVLEKLVDDTAVLKIYRGSLELEQVSDPFDPTIPFTLGVIDATAESGFFAVTLNGSVVLGASASQVFDVDLYQSNVGSTDVALVLGSPASVAETFDVDLTTNFEVQTFLGTGFLGVESYDLFSFPLSSATSAVLPPVDGPTSGGFEDTGKPAFSAFAESLTDGFISAIQVVVAFNSAAVQKQFTGSATLLTSAGDPMEQVLFDQTYKLLEDDSINCVFMNPKTWLGALVNVSVTIDGADYQVTVPVIEIGGSEVSYHLAPQPASWYHKRVSNSNVGTNLADFGPAVIIDTP